MAPKPRNAGIHPSCLYPDEAELAHIVLGADRAHLWPEIAAAEEKVGFPRVDPLYGGRYWPDILAFYGRRSAALPPIEPHPDKMRGQSDFDEWKAARAARR